MTHPNPSTALARVVVDEMANRGVRLVVLSPGSRSAALAIAAHQHPEIETRVVIDERSAAFHALGAARASGRPAAAVSTSGSAPANFYPAVVEADMSCVPLMVVSADRPAEMQGIGANQTIDQIGMFGDKVRACAGIEAPDGSGDENRGWRGVVSHLVGTAVGSRPGPVHLNVRFREPTVPVPDDGRSRGEEYRFDTPRVGGDGDPVDEEIAEMPLVGGDRGLIIAGDGEYDRHALQVRAADLGWPVLATALSGIRGEQVVTTYHHLLARGVPDSLRPDTVVAVGATGPSPRLDDLFSVAAERIRIDRWGRRIDPGRTATHVLRGDVGSLLANVTPSGDEAWLMSWQDAERRARQRIDSIVDLAGDMCGALVASTLNQIPWGSLVVASSLPIREVDAHLRRSGPVFANRGASGIDGFVSTALGVASCIPRTLALAGDLSLLHDSNGFLLDGSIDLTMVVVDNHGGGLFDSLPQALHAPDYERIFVTDPRRDLAKLAAFHGIRYREANDREALLEMGRESLERSGIDLIGVRVDRVHDHAMRSQLEE